MGGWARAPLYHVRFGGRPSGLWGALWLLPRCGARYLGGQWCKLDQIFQIYIGILGQAPAG